VAYDLDRGRLWMVCRFCSRWSLVPIEARWEALEELERVLSGGPIQSGRSGPVRLVSRTDHITLFSVGPLEVVRVGGAEYSEEAWWRYGRELGGVARKLPRLTPWLRAKGVAWKGHRECSECGYLFTEVPFSDRNILVVQLGLGGQTGEGLASQEDGPGVASASSPTLARRCPKCRDAVDGGLHLRGPEAEITLFRLLAFDHNTGAPIDRIRTAARMIQDPGGPSSLVRVLTRHGRPLGDLPPVGVLALEMVTNDARERTLLKMELAELEFRWNREEELAALIDGELTPVGIWGRVLRRAWGGG